MNVRKCIHTLLNWPKSQFLHARTTGSSKPERASSAARAAACSYSALTRATSAAAAVMRAVRCSRRESVGGDGGGGGVSPVLLVVDTAEGRPSALNLLKDNGTIDEEKGGRSSCSTHSW